MQALELIKALADESRPRAFRSLAEAGLGLWVAEMVALVAIVNTAKTRWPS